MATLDITEYQSIARDHAGASVPAGVEPARNVQQVTIGVASAQSAAFHDRTKFVRIHTDAACRIAFGEDPTAAVTSQRMAANQTEFFGVEPGHKVAVIAAS